MNKSRALAGALAVGALTIASLFAAAPAHAATLPAGQKITVIDYYESTSRSYEASPSDAVLTGVGAAVPLDESELAAVDVDDVGNGFALGNYYGDGYASTLYLYHAQDGTFVSPLTMVLNFGDVQEEADYCSALDYSGGIIMAICEEYFDGYTVAYWGTVQLEPFGNFGEAWLTPLYQFDDDNETDEYIFFDSMAVDPISGLVYAIGYPTEGNPFLYTLSEDAGATEIVQIDGPAWGFDFDRGGQAWITTWVEILISESPTEVSALATLSLTDGSFPFLEPMTVEGEFLEEPFVQPITVWGSAPTLPATGPADLSLPIAAGALLLLAGTILAGVTVLRRRQEA